MTTLIPRQRELHRTVSDVCQATGDSWPEALAYMVRQAGGINPFLADRQLTRDELDQVMDLLRRDVDLCRAELLATVGRAIRADYLTEVERMQAIREAHHTYQQALAAPAVPS